MFTLFIILGSLSTWLVYGARYSRNRYAVLEYNRAKMTRCSPNCGSWGWTTPKFKVDYCNCGYLRGARGQTILPMLFFPFYMLQSYLTSGNYTPKGVDYDRIRELERELEIR